MRDILDRSSNKLTQGSIFNNVKSKTEFKDDVFGVFISARCDIENHHTNKLNYLKIISLNDWFDIYFPNLFFKRYKKEMENKLKNILDSKALDYEAFMTFSDVDKLIDAHFKKKIEKSNIKEILKYLKKHEEINNMNRQELLSFFEPYQQKVEYILNDLIENKLKSFFYLEKIDYYKKIETGFVVLLQETETMSLDICERLIDGINEKEIEKYKEYFCNNEITMIICEMKSPYIEFLVQEYTALFRIGVDRAEYIKFTKLSEGVINE